MILRKGAVVLVADGKKYLLLRNTGTAEHPMLTCETAASQHNPGTAQQGSDEPGRAFGPGPGRSAMEQTDFHQVAEDLFARQTAELLNQMAYAGALEDLIVVAPPRCLAELRDHLGAPATHRLVAELDKDLTNHPVNEILKILVRSP